MIRHPSTGPCKLRKGVNRWHVSITLSTQTPCICKVQTQRGPWLPQRNSPSPFSWNTKAIDLAFFFSTVESWVQEIFCFPLSFREVTIQLCWWNGTGPRRAFGARAAGRGAGHGKLDRALWDRWQLPGAHQLLPCGNCFVRFLCDTLVFKPWLIKIFFKCCKRYFLMEGEKFNLWSQWHQLWLQLQQSN